MNTQRVNVYISGSDIAVFYIEEYNESLKTWFTVGDTYTKVEHATAIIDNHNLKKYTRQNAKAKGAKPMILHDLEKELMKLAQDARDKGYTVITPKLFADNVYGNKLAYYQHGTNKIVMHEHFVENAPQEEIENTLIHELAHAVAEQNNTAAKRVWHGEAWKTINAELGGNAERYHQGEYKKPEVKKLSMQELFAIQPTKPANEWERGTFNQWLRRGYHVMKGQHGQLSVWTFVSDEYELREDGKTGRGGKVSAMYFTPDQVEANKPK